MIKQRILDFYLETSIYTNYEPFKDYFKSLSDDIYELAALVNSQTIHRGTLIRSYYQKTNIAKEFPWYRCRCEDDILLTVPSMMAELFRLDNRGIIPDRKVEDKIVVTCRYVSIFMASILKAKGIPARCRAGFCVIDHRYNDKVSGDHWIVQYYNKNEKRWINLDTNRINRLETDYDYYDMPNERFDFVAKAWLDVRNGKRDIEYFRHSSKIKGLAMLARSLFYDFHALMNDEISYLFFPVFLSSDEKFNNLSEQELKELDDLATLMLNPDENFNELKELFENNKKYRVIIKKSYSASYISAPFILIINYV